MKGVRPRTVEAYVIVVRLLARWAGGDPAALGEERVREFFLHLIRDRQYGSLLLPFKLEIACPCCGRAMTFLHALRTRARPPPAAISPAAPMTLSA